MINSINRKNKIVLSDYNYKRDIENRLLMADLSVFEVDVLREIIHGSLKTTVKVLADTLDSTEKKVLPVLEKLSQTKLLTLTASGHIEVNKELRKYYEFQIKKYDDDFEPDMEFLQGLLSKVPIHVLPVWYSIPRLADSIFTSIVEKYLLTPKTYERYLADLQFEDPVNAQIAADVFAPPHFKVLSSTLREKYKLSREEFEECMLHLEFNFVCCLSYTLIDGIWEEVVTPFSEWREYLNFQHQNLPKPINNPEKIKRKHQDDFGFINDMTSLLKKASQTPLKVSMVGAKYSLAPQELPKKASEIQNWQDHFKNIISTSTNLELAKVHKNTLKTEDHANEWLKKTTPEQAMMLYRYSNHHYRQNFGDTFSVSDRDIREIERNLRKIVSFGWVYFDDFMKSFIAPIGNAEAVTLKNKGKRWRYQLPTYTEHEHELVKVTCLERLFEAGMIAVGEHSGKPCFCVTPFGRIALGE